MGAIPPTAFDILMHQLNRLPLWVKQVIAAYLRRELETVLSRTTLESFGPEHTLQLWVPEITPGGTHEMEHNANNLNASVLRVLHMAKQHKSVINIAIMNQWSLEQCCKMLGMALEQNWLHPPKSSVIAGTIEYLAGRTRLGEYLVKINRLTIDQLDQALRTQKAIQEALGEKTGIANVLINLGYIKKEDSESILFLKEESRKSVDLSGLTAPAASSASGNEQTAHLQAQLHQAMQRIRELESTNLQLQQRSH
jgi:hypothetical protein